MNRIAVLYPRLDRFRFAVTQTASGILPIALYVGGVAAVFRGLHLWQPPVAWIFLGGTAVNWALKLDPK